MAENTLLDEYVTLPQRYIVSGGLDKDEICYKLDIGGQLAKVREAVLTSASDWPDLVQRTYQQSNINFVQHRDMYPLNDWIDNKPDEALKALQAFWAKDDTPIRDRLEAFIPRVPDPDPRYPFHGGDRAWTRLRMLSPLLMALDPTKYPAMCKGIFCPCLQAHRTRYTGT